MSLLGLPERDRIAEYSCIELLPELEEDVFSVDVIVPSIDESFVSGWDDWWANFVADMCL
jgi:hypothetical protein